MAEREFIEFILTATDLASRKLNQAAANIEKDTARIEQSAKGASKGVDDLGASLDKSGTHGQTLRRTLSDVTSDMDKAKAKVAAYDAQLRKLPNAESLAARAIEQHRQAALRDIETLGREAEALERFARRTESLPGAIARFTSALFGNARALRQHGSALRDVEGTFGRLERAGTGIVRAFVGIEGIIGRVAGGIVDFASSLGKTTEELDKAAAASGNAVTSAQELGAAFGKVGGTVFSFVGIIGGAVAQFGFLTAVIVGVPFLIEGIAGAAVTAGGAIVALASALGTLSAVAVGIPAALTGVLGVLAAIATIIGPAVSGILGAVSAADKAQKATGTAGQTQQQQHVQAMQNAIQEKQAELSLAQLKISTAQTLINDQTTLNNLRKKDRIDETAAADDVAIARARLRRLIAEGAPQAEIKAARAELLSDEDTLHKMKADHQKQEGDAERKLATDRKNGVLQIQQAELNLRSIRLQNAQQQQQALTQEQQLMQKLSPLQQHIVNQIIDLKNQWDKLTASFRNRFLHEVSLDLQEISKNLPGIAKLVGGFANTITDAIKQVRQDLVGPDGKPTALGNQISGFATFINNMLRIAIGLGGSGQTAGGGLIGLGIAFTNFMTSPGVVRFIRFLTDTVNKLGFWARDAVKAGRATGSIGQFFGRAQSVLKVVGQIAGNIITILANIGKIAFPTGKGFLDTFKTLTDDLKKWTESKEGRKELVTFFQEIDSAARSAAGFVGELAKQTGILGIAAISGGTPGGGAPVVRGGRATTTPTSEGTPSGFKQFFDTLKSDLPGIRKAIEDFVSKNGPQLLDIFQQLGPALATLVPWWIKFVDATLRLVNWLAQHGDAVKLVAGIFAPFVGVVALVKSLEGLNNGLDRLRHWVEGFVEKKWDVVSKWWERNFHDPITSAVRWLRTTGVQEVGDAIGKVGDAIVSKLRDPLNTAIGGLNWFIGGIVEGINWVLDHVGLGDHKIHFGGIKPIGEGQLGGATSGGVGAPVHGGFPGGGGMLPDFVPMFAEGGVVPGPEGKAVTVVAHGGEVVLNRDQQRALGPHLSSVLGTVKSIGGSILGFAESGLVTVFKHLLPGVGDVMSGGGVIGTMARGAAGWLKDKVIGWGTKKLEDWAASLNPFGGSGGSGLRIVGGGPGTNPRTVSQAIANMLYRTRGGGGNLPITGYGGAPGEPNQVLNQVAEWIISGARLAHIKATLNNLLAIAARAWQESSWNPFAINLTDSNARAGHPSKGIMQMIDSTFGAHAVGGHGNIWNPIDNIASAIRYMLSRYHSLVGYTGYGYAAGGRVGSPAGAEGAPIRVTAHIGEWILNREQQERLAKIFGTRDKAFAALFNRPSFGGMFAAGGVVGAPGLAMAGAAAGAHIQVGPIHTTAPQIDIDYVVRAIELRLGVYS